MRLSAPAHSTSRAAIAGSRTLNLMFYPLLIATQSLPKVALARFYDLQRCVVEAVVATPAGRLRVYSLHLTHVSSGLRLPQVRTVLDIVADAPENGAPWLMVSWFGF